jgi:hypothetical protein
VSYCHGNKAREGHMRDWVETISHPREPRIKLSMRSICHWPRGGKQKWSFEVSTRSSGVIGRSDSSEDEALQLAYHWIDRRLKAGNAVELFYRK